MCPVWWILWLVMLKHQPGAFVLQWRWTSGLTPWPRRAVLCTYPRLSAGLARSSNPHSSSQPGWLDSPHAAIFTPGRRFLKSNRVTISGLRERPGERNRENAFFFPTRKRFGYKYQTGNSLICQWSLPEEGGGCRVLLGPWAVLNSFTNRGGEEPWEE